MVLLYLFFCTLLLPSRVRRFAGNIRQANATIPYLVRETSSPFPEAERLLQNVPQQYTRGRGSMHAPDFSDRASMLLDRHNMPPHISLDDNRRVQDSHGMTYRHVPEAVLCTSLLLSIPDSL